MSEITHIAESQHDDHAHGDSFTFLGRTFPVPLYTGVFGLLGILTLIEVTISQVIPRGELPGYVDLVGLIMIVIAVCKASLVVWFYMHLNKDSRIFMIALLVPTILVIVCVLFLSIVPPGSY
ncbi:MAG: cytochrome C oxidase subunit IV family protein [Anaerolineae bacterium]